MFVHLTSHSARDIRGVGCPPGVDAGVKLNARGPVLWVDPGGLLAKRAAETLRCPRLRCAITSASAVTCRLRSGRRMPGVPSSVMAL